MQIGPVYLPFEYMVVGLVIVFVVISLIANQRRRQQFAADNARIDQEAAARGWLHEGTQKGTTIKHTFSGRSRGVSWHIESAVSTGNDDDGARRYTRWWTDQVTLPGEVILILPKMHNAIQLGQVAGSADSKNPLARMAMGLFLKNIIGDDRDIESFDGAHPVEAGGSEFKEQFSVLATTASSAGRFLDRDGENALIHWGESGSGQLLAVLFWKNGLTVTAHAYTAEPSQLERLIDLGAALASGQRGA